MIYLIRLIFISKLRFSPSYTTVHLYDVFKGEVRFHQNVNWKSDNDDSDDEVAVDDNVDDDDKDNDNNDCDIYNVNDDNFLKAEVNFPSECKLEEQERQRRQQQYIYYDEVCVCLSITKIDHFPLPS